MTRWDLALGPQVPRSQDLGHTRLRQVPTTWTIIFYCTCLNTTSTAVPGTRCPPRMIITETPEPEKQCSRLRSQKRMTETDGTLELLLENGRPITTGIQNSEFRSPEIPVRSRLLRNSFSVRIYRNSRNRNMKMEITAFGTSDRKLEYTTKVICNFPLLSVGVCFGCN